MKRTSPESLDDADLRILERLQRDGRASHADLADVAHLSAPQCFRRVKRLEEARIIEGYGARLSRTALGFSVVAFVSVTLGGGRSQDLEKFRQVVADIPEILECHVVTGEADFLLKVVAADLRSFSEFLLSRLGEHFDSVTTRSEVSLEEVKAGSILPVVSPTRG
jgi:Lrp/AsnC family transcriptional regulator, leucine-responsive regulatory protein